MNESALAPASETTSAAELSSIYLRRHLRIGWAAVLGYLTLGIVLEALHGFKSEWYLSVGNETRRLMWTLAHAHGVLIGVLHIAFGVTARCLTVAAAAWRLPSAMLTASTLLLPGGFFLGGLNTYGADPGRGVILVPFGAAALLIAVALTLRAVLRAA